MCNNNGFTCPTDTNPLVICPKSAADCACNAGGITCPTGFVSIVNCPLTIADCECGNTFSCPIGSTASTSCPLTLDECDCGSTDFTCPEGFIPLPGVFCPVGNNDCVCSGDFECPAGSSSQKLCPLELSDCECADEKNTIQDGECKGRPLPRAQRCQITRPEEGYAYVWPSSPYEKGVFAMLDGKCSTGFHLRKGAITGERFERTTNTATCYGFGQIYYMYFRDTLTGKESNSVRCTGNYYSSPIGIDVDGSGAVERIDGNFTIDISGDGNMEFLHEWFAPTEGILISMTPFIKDGHVTGENMFGDMGTRYKDGYEKLGLLDRNKDQIVSGTELQGLAIWLDINSNTVLDDGELFSLEHYGITGLRTDEHGHFESSAILEDGSELYMEDLWFTSERHEEAARGTDSS